MPNGPNYLLKASILTAVGILLTFTELHAKNDSRATTSTSANTAGLSWNLLDKGEPLLSVPDTFKGDQDLTFSFPFGQFAIPLTQPLHYNAQSHRQPVGTVANLSRRFDWNRWANSSRSLVFRNASVR